MRLSKEEKSTLAGVIVFIFIAFLLNVLLKYSDIISFLSAGIGAIIAWLIVYKIQGG